MTCYFSYLDNSELKYIEVLCHAAIDAKISLLKEGFKDVKRIHKKTFKKQKAIFLSGKDTSTKG